MSHEVLLSPELSPEVLLLPEQMGCWVLCVGVSGVLSLFGQNKLVDVSLFGWMPQKTPFADGLHSRGSLY
jgi:hypothetical protein